MATQIDPTSAYAGLLSQGMTQDQLQQLVDRQRGMELAAMDPAQRAFAQMYGAGAGIGRSITGMLGGTVPVDPQIAAAQNMNKLMSGVDMSNPPSMFAKAQELSRMGLYPQAQALVKQAQELVDKQAEAANKYASGQKHLSDVEQATKASAAEEEQKKTTRTAMEARGYSTAQIDAVVNNPKAREAYLSGNTTQTIDVDGRVKLIDKLTNEVIKDLGKAPDKGVRVNVDAGSKQQDAFATKRGTTQAETLDQAQKDAQVSAQALNRLKPMESLARSNSLYTGPQANVTLAASNFLNSLGLLRADEVAQLKSSEIYDKLAKDLVMKDLGDKLGTGVSNADRDYIEKRIPQLTTSPKARLELVNKLQEIHASKIKYYQNMKAHANKYGNLNEFDFSSGIELPGSSRETAITIPN